MDWMWCVEVIVVFMGECDVVELCCVWCISCECMSFMLGFY